MKEVTVMNGLLLDKILGVVYCEVIGNVSGTQDTQKSPQVNVYDASPWTAVSCSNSSLLSS